MTPLRLDLSPSGWFGGTILAFHAAAAACFLTTVTGFAGAALAFLVAVLGVLSARNRAFHRGPRAPRSIELRPGGTPAAVVRLANGESLPVRAIRGIGVTRHWVALGATSGAGPAVLVTSGMVGTQNARKLRLWALWGRVPAAAAEPRQP